MTPEEAVLDKTMKGVGAANGALRKGIEATNVELVKTSTAVLTKAFSDTETFWKARGKDDAVKMAQIARVAAQVSRRPPPPRTGATSKLTRQLSPSNARVVTGFIESASRMDRLRSSAG